MNARELRLLFVVASAVVFVDTMFYAAVVPLLPTLTHELHLSKASAGVLTAGYAAGTLVGSIPGGMLAARAGPRATIYAGLVLMGSSSLAFGLLDNIAGLDAARFVQGFGGACTWSGSLAWLIVEVEVGRRGSVIGGALAAGIAGALFGPVIGTLAHAFGRAPVFSAVAVVAAALGVAVALLPAPSEPPDLGPLRLLDQLRRPVIVLGMWLTALPAIASGVVNVLAPLRLSALGASALAIGATFLIAAGAEAVISPAVGQVSDRRGRIFPLRIGLGSAAIVLALFTIPTEVVVVVAGVVVFTAVTLGAFWAPAMAMLSDAAETGGLSQGYAMALINLAWAAGQIVGAAGGGALAKATSDAVPFGLSAALCAATLGLMLVRPVRAALPR